MFAVGLLAAAWTQERGGTPSLEPAVPGLPRQPRFVAAIGFFFVIGVTAAVFASSLVDGGKLLDLLSNAGGTMNEEEIATALADGALQAGMLFSALLSIPVLIATWWAPALVVFQNAGAGCGAGREPARGARQLAPLAIYVLGVFFYARGAARPSSPAHPILLLQETAADRHGAAAALRNFPGRDAAHLRLRELPRRVPCRRNAGAAGQ